MKFPSPLVSNEPNKRIDQSPISIRLVFGYFIYQNPKFQSKQQQNENQDHFRKKIKSNKIYCCLNISMHEIDLFQIPAGTKCSFNSWMDSSNWTISICHFAHFGSVFQSHHVCWNIYCFWYIVLGSFHHNNNNLSLHDCVLDVTHFSMCLFVHFLRFNNDEPMTVRNYGNIFELMILIVCTLRRKNHLIREVVENFSMTTEKRRFFVFAAKAKAIHLFP